MLSKPFFAATALALVLSLPSFYQLPARPPITSSIQVTGPSASGLAAFDTFMTNVMAQWSVPGAALAVVKDGRLVFAHGYGLANTTSNQPVQPNSLFRIASVSKPITAAAIFLLVQQGKLHLNDKVFTILNGLRPPAGFSEDPRIQNITIQELLWHSGGWNRDTTFDPMFQPTTWNAADATGTPRPATCTAVIQYMLGKPLQFAPGTSYDYSNFGYCVLGRIIEKITGSSYEQFAQQNVLSPFGITDMKIAHSLVSQQASGEVAYYDPTDGTTTSVFPGGGTVPWPYGGFYIEAMDSHGGWIASPIDLMRFVVGLDGKASNILLNSTMMQQMLARPTLSVWVGSSYYYASGWNVRPSGPDANWWHLGDLPGTSSEIVRDNSGIGVDFAVIFNSQSSNTSAFQSQVDSGLQQIIGQIQQWPTQDLFGSYGPPITTTTTTSGSAAISSTSTTSPTVSSTAGSTLTTSQTTSSSASSASASSATTSTISSSTAYQTTTSGSTANAGSPGIPELPPGLIGATAFTALIVIAYIVARGAKLFDRSKSRLNA